MSDSGSNGSAVDRVAFSASSFTIQPYERTDRADGADRDRAMTIRVSDLRDDATRIQHVDTDSVAKAEPAAVGWWEWMTGSAPTAPAATATITATASLPSQQPAVVVAPAPPLPTAPPTVAAAAVSQPVAVTPPPLPPTPALAPVPVHSAPAPVAVSTPSASSSAYSVFDNSHPHSVSVLRDAVSTAPDVRTAPIKAAVRATPSPASGGSAVPAASGEAQDWRQRAYEFTQNANDAIQPHWPILRSVFIWSPVAFTVFLIGRSSGWRRVRVAHVPRLLKRASGAVAIPRVTLRGTVVHTSLPASDSTHPPPFILNRIDRDAAARAKELAARAASEYVGTPAAADAVAAATAAAEASLPRLAAPYVYQPYPVFDFYHTPMLRALAGRGTTHEPIEWRTDTVPLCLAGIRLVDAPFAQQRAELLLNHRTVWSRLLDVSPLNLHERQALEATAAATASESAPAPAPAEFVVPAIVWSRTLTLLQRNVSLELLAAGLATLPPYTRVAASAPTDGAAPASAQSSIAGTDELSLAPGQSTLITSLPRVWAQMESAQRKAQRNRVGCWYRAPESLYARTVGRLISSLKAPKLAPPPPQQPVVESTPAVVAAATAPAPAAVPPQP